MGRFRGTHKPSIVIARSRLTECIGHLSRADTHHRQLNQGYTLALSDNIELVDGSSSDKCAAALLANDVTFHAKLVKGLPHR